jgi:hypothetical protein
MRHPVFELPEVLILSYPRSGTHFLQSSLASHPKIHGRGECIMRFKRLISQQPKQEQSQNLPDPFIFTNKPNHLNVAILMYKLVDFATDEFGCSLTDFKIIHLIRNPKQVAYSNAQAGANRKSLGAKFKAHYRLHECLPPNSPISLQMVDKIEKEVILLQKKYSKKLGSHPNVLTIDYETLTSGRQVNKISKEYASLLLNFLGLNYAPLRNSLRKTGIEPNVGTK